MASPFPKTLGPTAHAASGGFFIVVLVSLLVCGCVVVGDPAFCGRYGFRQYPGVAWHGVPDENVLCLLLSCEMPTGEVVQHPAFLTGT